MKYICPWCAAENDNTADDATAEVFVCAACRRETFRQHIDPFTYQTLHQFVGPYSNRPQIKSRLYGWLRAGCISGVVACCIPYAIGLFMVFKHLDNPQPNVQLDWLPVMESGIGLVVCILCWGLLDYHAVYLFKSEKPEAV